MKLLITCSLLGWFLYISDISKICFGIYQVPISTIIFILLVQFIALLINNFKWLILLPNYSFIYLLKLSMIGRFYSLILPGQIAGEAVKAYIVGKGQKHAEHIATSVIIDKVTGILGLLLMGWFGMLFNHLQLPRNIVLMYSMTVCLGIIFLFAIRSAVFYDFIKKMIEILEAKFVKSSNLLDRLFLIIEAWRNYVKHGRIILLSVIIGIVYQVLGVLIHMLFAKEIGIALSFFDWSWILGIVAIAILLPITIAGIGIREGAFIGILGGFGVLKENALALSFLILALQVLDAFVGGILEWTRKAPLKIESDAFLNR